MSDDEDLGTPAIDESETGANDPNRPTLPVVLRKDRSTSAVIHGVEQNLVNSSPQDALKWSRVRGTLKEQDRIERTARFVELEAFVKIGMPIVFFAVGCLFLAINTGALFVAGLLLIGAAIATYGSKASQALVTAVARLLGGIRDDFQ